jgi:hypothetical protein
MAKGAEMLQVNQHELKNIVVIPAESGSAPN